MKPKPETNDTIRAFVQGAYDLQNLRISAGNRLAANFRTKLGIPPNTKEADADKEVVKILDTIRASYRKLTDGLKMEIPSARAFKGDEIISDYGELCLVNLYIKVEKDEDSHFRRLKALLDDIPIWSNYLKTLPGCGPAMAGVMISELDPHKARHASSFWKYAGLDVAKYYLATKEGKKDVGISIVDLEAITEHEANGWTLTESWSGRSRRAEHLIIKEYLDKDKKPATRKAITFNPWLKTKLYVLAGCLIKQGGTYKDIYDGYKHRLENRPDWADKTKGHRHNAAMRYMIKMFLADLWAFWRNLEGLPVSEPYAVAKLGLRPHGQDEHAA